jgi:anti-anti-sigma factor
VKAGLLHTSGIPRGRIDPLETRNTLGRNVTSVLHRGVGGSYGRPMPGSPVFRALPTTTPRGFRLEGEIDLSNAATLGDLLKPAVEAGGDLTIDLSGVAFMDSTAIQVMLKAAKQISGRGRLVLYHPGSLVSNVLRLIKAERLPGIVIQDEPD